MLQQYSLFSFIIAGVIDRDYRGNVNVGVILFNFGNDAFKSKRDNNIFILFYLKNFFFLLVNKGDRIAQLICEKISYPKIEECKV